MAAVRAISGALLALLGGCAAWQSQHNTTDMAGTISRIREVQVLQNIAAAIDDRSFVPSGIVLGTGQANVIVGLAPSLKGTGLNVQSPSIELDLSPTDTWTAQWQFTSITEQGDLRRLRNVYALIVSTDAQYDELQAYFHPSPLAAGGTAAKSDSDAVFQGLFDGLLPPAPQPPTAAPVTAKPVRSGNVNKPSTAVKTEEDTKLGAQRVISWPQAKAFITNGDSIDCRLFQAAKTPSVSGVPFRRWLFWRQSRGPWLPQDPGAPVQSLGHYGNWELGTISLACFDDFVILLQGVTPAASGVTSQGARYMLQ